MFPDKKEYKEAAHIGEELFEDKDYELERQCMSVQRGVERNLFPLDVALNAYNVTREQYEEFLAKNINKQLQAYLLIQPNAFGYSTYFHIMDRMVHLLAGEHNSHNMKYLHPLLKELRKLSKDIEKEKVTFEYHQDA
jgi:hypothetical protein